MSAVTFAQFFREQLAENVRMGMQQAVRQGRWINRPPTGYDLEDGVLMPNDDAPRVREVFRLRAEGESHRAIENRTGITYSTVGAILRSEAYLGHTLLNGEWFPGLHEPLVTPEQWAAARKGQVPGRRRGKDLLAHLVFCGLCGKRMHVEQNGQGRVLYRCRSRGRGCDQPQRTNKGLIRAAVLGLELVAHDEELQQAIRQGLAADRRTAGRPAAGRRRSQQGASESLAALSEKRRKLLDLYYSEKITADGFAEAEALLAQQIEAARSQTETAHAADVEYDELAERFEAVVATLRALDFTALWERAVESERRVLIEELVHGVRIFPDHLEVEVAGAPPLNVTLAEVGLKSEIAGVGEGT
jgi:hypothetical protein